MMKMKLKKIHFYMS